MSGSVAARILVVEDELLSARVMSSALQRAGYEIRVAARGDEAIAIGKTFHPDVLVTDWMLNSEQTGLDVAQELQQENNQLSVLLITGRGADELRDQIGSLRVSALLVKPCGLDEIVAAVERALER